MLELRSLEPITFDVANAEIFGATCLVAFEVNR